MKKLILMLAIVMVVCFTFTSCKKEKKEEDVKTEEKADMASNEVYQCPMDCEDGKSYTEAGSCPVCKMDLKAKTVDMDSDDHKMHADNCTCKSGGECKCADGECKCMADNSAKNDNKDKDTKS
ncbi:heavy metal-binding domain-containing protein [Aureibaculum sp. 2210JD6-5]|uniref:heavy metal-binding domain-containing protein n=1 Tax=Aureibaculum sp. 2210JD6-5 TaxID=3103957 RepID=UPI002AAE2610|nr:heavy metal-binding domain-containing protein [Aureibaculum sp. 2210JD6-5]MDY7395332.1 heavy metal-binding domain-containing protein [Aureibaculum sp. 2210JD6-5]